jgi:predicted methyltransferase
MFHPLHASRLTAVLGAAFALALLDIAAPRIALAADSVYATAVATAGRSDKDRERDQRDKPAEVLALAGFKPGMRIADIFGGGGYYSELLSYVVGPRGRVLLVNDPAYAAFAAEDLAVRFKDGRLPEIARLVVPNEDLNLGRETLDGALIVMSYHDLYFQDKDKFPRIDAASFLGQIHAALKPGAVFLVVDHSAVAGSGNAPAQTLHRIDEKFAIHDIESRGFKLVKTWDGLRNSADARTALVFDPAIRGKTDRFVHLYQRQ